MIIDFHTHILPPRIKENRLKYLQHDRTFAAIYSDPKAKMATVEELMASMDKNSVDMAVLLNYSWSTQLLYQEINDYILDSVAVYPKRLVGFCNAKLSDGDKSLCEIERCLRAGAKGVGEMRLDLLPEKSRTKQLNSVATLLIENEALLLLHSSEPVGHAYPGKGTATPDVLYKTITAFPNLTIVCAHWGGGLLLYSLMPEVKVALKNIYFDTAASPFLYQPDIYLQSIQLGGDDKILFGSDYPMISPNRYFKEIDNLSLSSKVKEKLLGGNAITVLSLRF